ncbi:MAG TPA: PEP-CTERM sorting domain-containing protein [Acidobacteriaceae bacterium]|nr:PEP-CTERM sorting domain-containing protein [Acidobacteriaceae bacterium]
MNKFALSLTALALGVLVAPAFADYIPYGQVGHVASTNVVKSTGTSLDVYFYGSSAADTDSIKVQDVTQGWTSGLILDNHTSTVGEEYVFPTGSNQLHVGDTLVFYLVNQSTHDTYSSDPADSDDGYNHAYMTPYSATGPTAIPGIPPGMFVGFEDLYIGANRDGVCSGEHNQSDCDYNDDEFVFVGVAPNPTPEPNSLALLGTSILGVAGVVRRRFIKR